MIVWYRPQQKSHHRHFYIFFQSKWNSEIPTKIMTHITTAIFVKIITIWFFFAYRSALVTLGISSHCSRKNLVRIKRACKLWWIITADSLVNDFTVCLCRLSKITLANLGVCLKHVWTSGGLWSLSYLTYFLAMLPCSEITAINLVSTITDIN